MKEKSPVYWHQGMFLQPQHFQLSDQYAAFLQKPVLKTGLPHFWGVGALELSPAALANRTIEIRSAQLIFPDCSYIEFPGNAAIATRTFNDAWVEGDKQLDVYVGLRQLNPQQPNVTDAATLAHAGEADTRYASLLDVQETADVYARGPAAPVRTLLHVVKVFFGSEIEHLQGYELIPLASLVRDGDAIVLANTFVPPCYALAGSTALTDMIKDMRDEFAGRARQLQEYKSPREIQRAEVDADYIAFMLALRSLNRYAPMLFHLVETPQTHPWAVYGVLRQMVGELSSFSERFDMFGQTEDGHAGLPPYDHAALSKCFARARALVSHLLNELTIGPDFLTVLEQDGDQYAAQVPRGYFSQRSRFYLVLRTQEDGARVLDALRLNARLAASSEIPMLARHALPGLELIHMPVAPQGLPRRANAHYFRIEQVSRQWDAVERDNEIALHWPDAPADLKAEIVVLKG